MDEVLARWVELEGCFNFRDLGGYRTAQGGHVRPGLVFRADGLQRLTPRDLGHLREEVRLGAVIDLRSDAEIASDGRGRIAHEPLAFHHVPLFNHERRTAEPPRAFLSNMAELYFFMLRAASAPIARVVELLAASEQPTVFHCAAGKDRTGVISALLLDLLGVPEQTIVADYALSRRNLDRINARLGESETYQDLMRSLPSDAYDADPAAMRGFLQHLRGEYGSAREWAAQAGVEERALESLRARLLAEP